MAFQYLTSIFHGLKDRSGFIGAINKAIQSLNTDYGSFTGDNLFTYGKNLSFLTNQQFMRAFAKSAKSPIEQSIIWRNFTVAWGARNGLRLDGDFVECGCYKGVTARIACDYIDFGKHPDRRYFLYDLFEHDSTMPHHAMPEHSNVLFEETKQRFADMQNVSVIQGRVPDSFEQGIPEKIAFMHIDLNNAEAEMSALEVLFDRMVPGAVMVLDDYGWAAYHQQKKVEDPWLAARGYHVLELPTGQGLVIK